MDLKKTAKFSVVSVLETASGEILFEELYAHNSCANANAFSKDDRTLLSQDHSLTYGEVPFCTMDKLLRTLRKHGATCDGKFYDLGSGSGKPVFAAALLQNFSTLVGIEILPSLSKMAKDALSTWKAVNGDKNVVFIEGSFLDMSLWNWTDGDVVFANSTCYDRKLMDSIGSLAQNMKQRSFLVTLSYPIDTKYGFDLIDETRFETSWGSADFFFHRKR